MFFLIGFLIPEDTLIDITFLTEVDLQCTVVGYVPGSIDTEFITWSLDGVRIRSNEKYRPTVSLSDCPPYGLCAVGSLLILNVNSNDVGEYVCSHDDLSQTITLNIQTSTSLIHTSTGPTVTNTNPEINSSSSQTALIVGLVTAAGCVIVIMIVFIIVLCLMLRKKLKPSMTVQQPFYDYVEPSQPPTLPDRRIMLKENDAYETNIQTPTTLLQSNIAYSVAQPMEMVPTQASSLESTT